MRSIEDRFGAGNFDDAGDAIVEALRDVYDQAERCAIDFSFDTVHANPWFHALVVAIDPLPESAHAELLARLIEVGLQPEGL
ncbi:hypothetical protein [Lysobacter sp. ESA13C]|uniref:hypothetical protein n=1 Tax=Lysobacter sp. ESA13C TaxID=2862676 RepID=UPI001CC17BA2|nr:hypothetical protein [Lysobacter sp. ESA13C]